RVAHDDRAARQAQREAVVAGARVVAAVEQGVDAGRAVDDEAPRHAEAHAERGPVGVDEQDLAAAPHAGDAVADGRAWVALLHGPRVRHVHADDRAAHDALSEAAVGLDLGQFGQGQALSWRQRASTASSMGSVSFPVKVFCWLTWLLPTSQR